MEMMSTLGEVGNMSVAPAKRQESLATAADVAAFLGGDFSVKTLANWRSQGKGPKYHKFGEGSGAAVRYDWADVKAWLAEQRKNSEAA
jgi:hypothetical protein